MKWSDVFFDYHTIAAQKFLRAQKRRSREEVEGQNTGNRYCEKNSLRRVDRKKKKKKRDRNNSDKLFLSRLPECSKKKRNDFAVDPEAVDLDPQPRRPSSIVRSFVG